MRAQIGSKEKTSTRGQVKRMVRYEVKKVFAKRSSRIALAVLFGAMLLMLHFLISGTRWVNENGELVYGFGTIEKAREAKREWAGLQPSARGSKALRPSGVAAVPIPCPTLALIEEVPP